MEQGSGSWMSDSDYGGTERNATPNEKVQYGEPGQNMLGDIPEPTVVPDEELKTKIVDGLREDNHVDHNNIAVEVHYGEALLTGTVPNRAMLKAADNCVRSIPGIVKLVNDIRIQVF